MLVVSTLNVYKAMGVAQLIGATHVLAVVLSL